MNPLNIMVISPEFLLSVPDTQMWIIHGTALRSKVNYKKDNSKGDCLNGIRNGVPEFRLNDESGNYFVSNKGCTNDTEIVLDQGEEVENVYIEKIKTIRYHQKFTTGEFVKQQQCKKTRE